MEITMTQAEYNKMTKEFFKEEELYYNPENPGCPPIIHNYTPEGRNFYRYEDLNQDSKPQKEEESSND